VPAAECLTPLQRELLDFIAQSAEPTWIMVAEMPELRGDGLAERELAVLRARGLAANTREASGGPKRPSEPDDWWSLTTAG
jgi:hypothetical protein